jgi:hypothetical protein
MSDDEVASERNVEKPVVEISHEGAVYSLIFWSIVQVIFMVYAMYKCYYDVDRIHEEKMKAQRMEAQVSQQHQPSHNNTNNNNGFHDPLRNDDLKHSNTAQRNESIDGVAKKTN